MQILYNRNVLYYVTKHSKHDRIQGYIIMHPQCQRIASIMLTYCIHHINTQLNI
jgi:hypothetical protein